MLIAPFVDMTDGSFDEWLDDARRLVSPLGFVVWLDEERLLESPSGFPRLELPWLGWGGFSRLPLADGGDVAARLLEELRLTGEVRLSISMIFP